MIFLRLIPNPTIGSSPAAVPALPSLSITSFNPETLEGFFRDAMSQGIEDARVLTNTVTQRMTQMGGAGALNRGNISALLSGAERAGVDSMAVAERLIVSHTSQADQVIGAIVDGVDSSVRGIRSPIIESVGTECARNGRPVIDRLELALKRGGFQPSAVANTLRNAGIDPSWVTHLERASYSANAAHAAAHAAPFGAIQDGGLAAPAAPGAPTTTVGVLRPSIPPAPEGGAAATTVPGQNPAGPSVAPYRPTAVEVASAWDEGIATNPDVQPGAATIVDDAAATLPIGERVAVPPPVSTAPAAPSLAASTRPVPRTPPPTVPAAPIAQTPAVTRPADTLVDVPRPTRTARPNAPTARPATPPPSPSDTTHLNIRVNAEPSVSAARPSANVPHAPANTATSAADESAYYQANNGQWYERQASGRVLRTPYQSPPQHFEPFQTGETLPGQPLANGATQGPRMPPRPTTTPATAAAAHTTPPAVGNPVRGASTSSMEGATSGIRGTLRGAANIARSELPRAAQRVTSVVEGRLSSLARGAEEAVGTTAGIVSEAFQPLTQGVASVAQRAGGLAIARMTPVIGEAAAARTVNALAAAVRGAQAVVGRASLGAAAVTVASLNTQRGFTLGRFTSNLASGHVEATDVARAGGALAMTAMSGVPLPALIPGIAAGALYDHSTTVRGAVDRVTDAVRNNVVTRFLFGA